MSDADDGFRVDMHVKVLDDRVVERAKARGMDALVYAPHFTRLPEIRRRAARYTDDELRIFPARELFTGTWQHRRHVLAVGLADPVPDFLTLAGTMDELERQGAAVLAPHPEFLNVSLDESELRQYRDLVDAVEVYNSKQWPGHNRRARDLAGTLDLPPFASSYAHLRGTVGGAWAAFEERLESTGDLVAALERGAPRRIYRRSGFEHRIRCALEFAHLGYENSWEKIDRLLLQGTEPTHPDHVVYDGRFDDVKVY